MRILHLFSNHKWTGPAEPAVNLADQLCKRGHEVLFAASDVPPQEGNIRRVHQHVIDRGLEFIPGLRLRKHLDAGIRADAAAIRGIVRKRGIHLIHTHLRNDHLAAALAVRLLDAPPPIVRTVYDGRPLRPGLRNLYLFQRHTDLAIFCSRRVCLASARRLLLNPAKTAVIDGAIDLHRFDPTRPLPAMRPKLNLRPEDYVVGIVARIQPHRRFHDLLRAAAIAAREIPGFRLVIIGRGPDRARLIDEPARRMGIAEIIRCPGYVMGDEYVGLLKALDVKAFLVPGSDGSCRAVREAMAMGLPVVAADRGMLPEIVDHETTGLIVSGSGEDLGRAFIALHDENRRREMAAAALRHARTYFDLATQAAAVEALYDKLLNSGSPPLEQRP